MEEIFVVSFAMCMFSNFVHIVFICCCRPITVVIVEACALAKSFIPS